MLHFQLVLASALPSLNSEPWQESGKCAAVILYEDVPTRDSALQLCDGLTKHFTTDLEFEFTWWKLSYLSEPEIARQAAQAAAVADLILISIQPGRDFSADFKTWFEDWLGKRNRPEGALGVLRMSARANNPISAYAQDAFLRLVAQRAKMDYLPFSGSERSGLSTDRLREDLNAPDMSGSDQTPKHQSHSSGWGINE